jgi:hypothetical protein
MWADPLPAGGTRVSFVIPAHEGQTVTRPPSMADPDAEPHAPIDPDPTGTVVPFHQRTSSASSS